MPSEVYLVPELNAFVAERGGIFGCGRRRVMGLGLPLIRVLSGSQFRAVLAHEFGHYYGGDTRLWPLVHNARSSIGRTLVNLSSDSLAQALSHIRIVGFLHYIAVILLVGYWKIFLRVTQAISRNHEYRADELAAYTTDPQALAEGLRIIHNVSPLLPMYFQMEVAPALHAGFRPPIADGFAQFLTAPSIAKGIPQYLETQLRNSASDVYDTHPPLRDRTAALERISMSTQPVDSTPAIALLDDVPKAELELLEFMVPDAPVRKFQHLPWERIGAEAYLPAWRGMVNHHKSLLAGHTVDRLPAVAATLKDLASRLPDPPGSLPTPERRLDRAAALRWQAFRGRPQPQWLDHRHGSRRTSLRQRHAPSGAARNPATDARLRNLSPGLAQSL
ncbi:MAG: M48 family metalloprotease [Bryobacterales bacterium]|nr:M48 family metalloprotease [Bryobacterales bacterium]